MLRIFEEPARAPLVLVDLQNDFLHPSGAYARAGVACEDIAALPARQRPLVEAGRRRGGWIVSTHFTSVSGRGGRAADRAATEGVAAVSHQRRFCARLIRDGMVEELGPADLSVDKVANSAFYMSRLE